jgi:hypothetical protein
MACSVRYDAQAAPLRGPRIFFADVLKSRQGAGRKNREVADEEADVGW